jgi:hypothetical protein
MKIILFSSVVLCVLFLSSFRQQKVAMQGYYMQDTVDKDTLNIDTVGISITIAQKYEARKRQYRTAYMWGDNKKPFLINPLGGIALNINKVYSHFSKIGKNSRRLEKLFQREFEIDSIEVLWKPLTVKLTDLKGDSLFYFQMYFLPEPGFLENATYYEKVEYVVKSMRIYRDSASLIHQRMKLPKWQEIKQKELLIKKLFLLCARHGFKL